MKKQITLALPSIFAFAHLAQAKGVVALDSERAQIIKRAILMEIQSNMHLSANVSHTCIGQISNAATVYSGDESKEYAFVFQNIKDSSFGEKFTHIMIKTDKSRKKILDVMSKEFRMGQVEVNKGTLDSPRFEKVTQPVDVITEDCTYQGLSDEQLEELND